MIEDMVRHDTDGHSRLVRRIIAGMMLLGGVAGVLSSVRLIYKQEEFFAGVVVMLALLLHACSGWVGWGLWCGKPHFYGWAKVLFTLESVFFNIGGIAFEFWNGLSARVAVDGWLISMPPPSHSVTVAGSFGATFNLNLTRQDSRWMVGINLIAVGILLWLFKPRKPAPAPVPASEGPVPAITTP